MNFNAPVTIYVQNPLADQIKPLLERIMQTQAELVQTLNNLRTQLTKVVGEINGRIDTLTTAVSNAGNLTPEVQTAMTSVQEVVDILDKIVPDAPTDPIPTGDVIDPTA